MLIARTGRPEFGPTSPAEYRRIRVCVSTEKKSTVTVDFFSVLTQTRILRYSAGDVGPNSGLPVRAINIPELPTDAQLSAVVSSTQPVATIANETAQNRLMS